MAAPAKFLFDTDFAAPDKARERAATACRDRCRRSRRPRHAPTAPATRRPSTRPRWRATAARRWRWKRSASPSAASPRVSPASRPGWRPRPSMSRSRWRASCAANWSPANRSARSWRWSSDCFSHLVATPHLVVRINDQLYEAAREKIERQAAQNGFEGRLVILAEPGIATGDCRIEWADGGVVLERAAIEAKISELVGRYLASRDQAGT